MKPGARIPALLRQLADEIDAMLNSADKPERFIDQSQSPLGRKLHCRLVRSGVLCGYRVGRKILVRESDIVAYVMARRVDLTEREPDSDEALLESIGLKVA